MSVRRHAGERRVATRPTLREAAGRTHGAGRVATRLSRRPDASN